MVLLSDTSLPIDKVYGDGLYDAERIYKIIWAFQESNSQVFERDKERMMQSQHEMDTLEKKIDAAKEYTETERNEKKKKGFKF